MAYHLDAFLIHLEQTPTDELERKLTDYQALQEAGLPETADVLLPWFEHLTLAFYLRRFDLTADLLAELKPVVTALYEASPHHSLLTELFVEWHHMALRFVAFTPKLFGEYPYFRAIIEATADKPGRARMLHGQAIIGTVVNYLAWLRQGGQAQELDPDLRQHLNRLYQGAADTAREDLAALYAEEAPELAYPLQRTLGRYLVQTDQLEAGFQELEQLAKQLATNPNLSETEVADFRLELGQLYARQTNYEAARGHLTQALNAYQAAGEAYEMAAAQAESWLEDLPLDA